MATEPPAPGKAGHCGDRQWAGGGAERDYLKLENDRLNPVAQDAVWELRKAGLEREAVRLERKFEGT